VDANIKKIKTIEANIAKIIFLDKIFIFTLFIYLLKVHKINIH